MIERIVHRTRMLWRTLARRRRIEEELDEELRFHVEALEAQALAHGDDTTEARRKARCQTGSVDHVKEACRDTRAVRPAEQLWHDVRFGMRVLARGRAFSVLAVTSLALGIGASSAIFSLINAVVLRPLPVADAHALHIAEVLQADGPEQQFSFAAVTRAASLLSGRAELSGQSSTETVLVGVRSQGGATIAAEPANLQLVAGDYFGVLRQGPQIGRLLNQDDNRAPGAHPVAVVSDRYWSRRFERNPSILGAELIVNGSPLVIVGVAARGFFGTTVGIEVPDVWAPAQMQAPLRFSGSYSLDDGDVQQAWTTQPGLAWLQVMVRVPAAGAPEAAGLMTLARRDARPASDDGTQAAPRVTLAPGASGFSTLRARLATPLLVLLLAVALLLAIACTNIGSLLLARATTRRREMAIRLSIGADRRRLIRQLLTESLLLAGVGGALGLTLAYIGSSALLTFLTNAGAANGLDVAPDWRVVTGTLVTTVVTAIAFGLVPALRSTRVALTESLKAQSRSVIASDGHAGSLPLGKLLIAGQVAMALAMLLVAALFMRSLQALSDVDAGFDRHRVLTMRIDPRSSGYLVDELPSLSSRVIERLQSLPGVESVSLSWTGAFNGRNRGNFAVEGYAPRPSERLETRKNWVTPAFFPTVGLAITQGRGFSVDETATSRRVCVIGETLARRYFPGQDPIGKRLSWGGTDFGADAYEIVGVVEDARYADLRTEPANMTYLLAAQADRYPSQVQIRLDGDPARTIRAVREALGASEPRLALGTIEMLDDGITRSMGVERMLGWLTLVFGGAALALACVGLYGSVSYAVRRRTAEFGVRVAVGAEPAALQWLIVREALVLVLAGGAVGLPLAVLAARGANQLLYGTSPFDPMAYGVALGIFLGVTMLAAYLPARRASRLHPMIALRAD